MVLQLPVTELAATTKADGARPDAPDRERNPGPVFVTVGVCDGPAHDLAACEACSLQHEPRCRHSKSNTRRLRRFRPATSLSNSISTAASAMARTGWAS